MTHKFHIDRQLTAVVILWIALWFLMVFTWLYDQEGYSSGMPPVPFFMMLFSPLVVGVIVGWYKVEVWPGMKAGMIAGALFGAANIIGNLIWGLMLQVQGRITPEQPLTFWEGVLEALGFLLFFAVIGLVLGAIGGLLGVFIARGWHHSGGNPTLAP
jgi:hypothetical protein